MVAGQLKMSLKCADDLFFFCVVFFFFFWVVSLFYASFLLLLFFLWNSLMYCVLTQILVLLL